MRKAALFLLLALACAWGDWESCRTLAPSGGMPGRRILLEGVPYFAQGDPRWADLRLGNTNIPFAQEGCAVTSAAMVLAGYGAPVDPGTLNAKLSSHAGYTPSGWLYWEKALEVAAGAAELARGWGWYEGPASYALIDQNLRAGNPVIVRLERLERRPTHFVVIIGKCGWRYRCLDPGRAAHAQPRWLDEIPAKITGLRFYRYLGQ